MKKVETAPHHAWKKLSALMMTLALMLTLLPAALAVDLNVDVGFYFKQSRGGTCTLASAAMMLRRRAYLDGLDGWVDVTENSIKSTAWSGGLSHSFTYNAMHVGYATFLPARPPRPRPSSRSSPSTRKASFFMIAASPTRCS